MEKTEQLVQLEFRRLCYESGIASTRKTMLAKTSAQRRLIRNIDKSVRQLRVALANGEVNGDALVNYVVENEPKRIQAMQMVKEVSAPFRAQIIPLQRIVRGLQAQINALTVDIVGKPVRAYTKPLKADAHLAERKKRKKKRQ